MPFQLGEFWTSSPSDFTMSVADLITLHEVIVNARESQSDVAAIVHRNAALALQKQVIGVPLATGGPTSECLPMSSGLGAPEFLPEWYGCNGAFFGQSCGIRYHAKQKIVVVVAMNVHAPSLCDVIIHEVLRSLVGDVKLPQPKIEENFPVMEEMIGNYNGSSGGNVSVTSQGKDIVCQLGGRLRGPRSQVLMKLDAFNRWVVRSDPGPSSLGVFRDPITGTPCLMVGAIAYRKSL
jgi:hypothetical protein